MNELKRALGDIAEAFRDYIMSLQPKQRHELIYTTFTLPILNKQALAI